MTNTDCLRTGMMTENSANYILWPLSTKLKTYGGFLTDVSDSAPNHSYQNTKLGNIF